MKLLNRSMCLLAVGVFLLTPFAARADVRCGKIVGLAFEYTGSGSGELYATLQTSSGTGTVGLFDRDEGDHGLVKMIVAAYQTQETIKVDVLPYASLPDATERIESAYLTLGTCNVP